MCRVLYVMSISMTGLFFFFNDTATTEIYTLSLHDALPIFAQHLEEPTRGGIALDPAAVAREQHEGHVRPFLLVGEPGCQGCRSEEHTSELQSRQYLVCRLLLEKKKKQTINYSIQSSNDTQH